MSNRNFATVCLMLNAAIIANGSELQTTYYAFMFGDEKAGYQVVTQMAGDNPATEIVTKFKMGGQLMRSSHRLTYSKSGQLETFRADEANTFSMADYLQHAPAYPTAGYQSIIDHLALVTNASAEFTAIMDGTGEVIGKKRFVVEGQIQWTNPISQSSATLFKVVEYEGNTPERNFLVDQSRLIHMANWQGPQSVLVGSLEQALEGLDFK